MSTPAEVTLRPMLEAEFEAWLGRTVATFAAGIGPVRLMLDDEESTAYGLDEIQRLLPLGLATEHQLIWTACATDGTPVGSLWVTTFHPVPFIFGLEVEEQYRSRGYGRAIMLAGERECLARGYHQLDLNVFRTNPIAVGLYENLGYSVVSQIMRKEF